MIDLQSLRARLTGSARTGAAISAAIGIAGLASLQLALPAAASAGNSAACSSSFSASWEESHAIKALNASLWGMGRPDENEFGAGFNTGTKYPFPVHEAQLTGAIRSVDATVDSDYTLALKVDGSVWNVGNQSPTGSTPDWVKVSAAGGMTNVVAISAGDHQAIALTPDGNVWAWGRNGYGQLGDNLAEAISATPIHVLGAGGVGHLSNVVAVASGDNHQLVLKGDGTVWAWGRANYGQLGQGDTAQHNTPVQVKGPAGVGFLTGVVAIAAGYAHNLALKADGSVWAWGRNLESQVGSTLAASPQKTPIQVMGVGGVGFLTGVAKVAAGEDFSMALKTDGTVFGWGDNGRGQLGDNSTTTRPTPVEVVGVGGTGFLTGIEDISAGGAQDHTLALKPNGTLYGWGYNLNGQLGNGGLASPQQTPVAAYMTNLVSVPGFCRNVSKVAPASGPQAGGTQVTITGSGFLGATAVTFSGSPATTFTVVSDTTINATVPAHAAGSTNVQVTTPRGITAVSAAGTFAYIAPAASPSATPALPKAGTGTSDGRAVALLLALLVLAGLPALTRLRSRAT